MRGPPPTGLPLPLPLLLVMEMTMKQVTWDGTVAPLKSQPLKVQGIPVSTLVQAAESVSAMLVLDQMAPPQAVAVMMETLAGMQPHLKMQPHLLRIRSHLSPVTTVRAGGAAATGPLELARTMRMRMRMKLRMLKPQRPLAPGSLGGTPVPLMLTRNPATTV